MISRVRGRLQSISSPHLRHNSDVKPQDDKNTKTMCILSALLLVPCFARLPSTFLFGSVALAYFVVVLPLLLSGLSRQTIVVLLEKYSNIAKGVIISESKKIGRIFRPIVVWKNHLELSYLKMGNISNLLNQIMFFAMCDQFFIDPTQTLTCLYTLMFYNTIAYCIAYIRNHILTSINPNRIELTKAITFLVTIVFMSLAFGNDLERGLENYQPPLCYIATTSLYYIITEKTLFVHLDTILEIMKLEILEGLEKLWAPVFLKTMALFMSAVTCLMLFINGFVHLSLISFYLNVYLVCKDLMVTAWQPLSIECESMLKYKVATRGELLLVADDVCAVCLQPMRSFARLTPCHHLFHSDCLRLCLKASTACPMCKRQL